MLRWKSCFVHSNYFLQIMSKINRKHFFLSVRKLPLLRSCALNILDVSLFCKVNPPFQMNKAVFFFSRNICVFMYLRILGCIHFPKEEQKSCALHYCVSDLSFAMIECTNNGDLREEGLSLDPGSGIESLR